jgi:hypothetical protein
MGNNKRTAISKWMILESTRINTNSPACFVQFRGSFARLLRHKSQPQPLSALKEWDGRIYLIHKGRNPPRITVSEYGGKVIVVGIGARD